MDFLTAPLPFTIVESSGANSPANLGNERLGRAMTWSVAAVGVTFDLGSARAVDTLSIIAATNQSNSSTIQWNAGNTAAEALSAPLFAVPTRPFLASPEGAGRVHQQSLVKLASPSSYRFWRAVISNPVGGNYSAGRAVIGKAFEPVEARDYGWSSRVVDLGTQNRSRSGIDDTLIAGKVLEFTWTWSGLTDEEARDNAIELLLYAGQTRDVLFCADPAAPNLHNLIGYGKLTEPSVITNYAEGWSDMSCQMLSRAILAL